MGVDGDQETSFFSQFLIMAANMRLSPDPSSGLQRPRPLAGKRWVCRGTHIIAGPRAPRPHDPPLPGRVTAGQRSVAVEPIQCRRRLLIVYIIHSICFSKPTGIAWTYTCRRPIQD